MIWDREIIDLANAIESHIRQNQIEKAIIGFNKLRKLTHIDQSTTPPPPHPMPGPHFGNGPLPDEDW